MADRPRTDPPEDGSEFTWLYGAGKDRPTGAPEPTRPVPRQQRASRPDETRVLPVQPRPGATTRPAAPTPQPTPRATTQPRPTPPAAPPPGPPTGAGRGRPRGFRRPRFRLRYLGILVLVWLIFLVATPFYTWSKVDKVDFQPDGDRPAEQPGTTYLMVGSDSRAGLSAAERKKLGTGNAEGGRTDSILLLHTGSGPNLLMSIPRDSLVDVPGHGTTKINAAFAFGGAKLLVETIEQSTGIRIDDYIETGFGGVVDAVDAVGGIEICPTTRMKDPLANLNIKKGCQQADGTVALGYARSRHSDPQYGDITRARHQREVISAVFSKALSPWTFINPLRYWRINAAVPNAVAFGDGTGVFASAKWATALRSVNGTDGLTCGVPIQDLSVLWDPDRSKEMFDYVIKDETDDIPAELCTPTGLPKSVTG